MSQVRVLSSMAMLETHFVHLDNEVFPNDTGWYSNYEKYIVTDDAQLKLYFVSGDNPSELLLLPLLKKNKPFGMVVLESLQNYYSIDYRPISSSVSARSLIPDAVKDIVNNRSADQVTLLPMDPDAPELDIIEDAFKLAGWQIAKSVCQINWVQQLAGSYEQYLSGRPKRLRNTIKRKSKRLMSMPDVDITIHTDLNHVENLVDDYTAVYAKSWKNDEPYPEFIPTLISTMAEQGYLRLGFVKIAGIPVAVHFWIVLKRKAYIYKLAHDPAYDSFSPGTVLMAEMIKHVIQIDRVHMLDFMSGDDDYKKDWMDSRREKIVLNAYNNKSIRGLAHFFITHRIRPRMRQLPFFARSY